jgi:drug/metabolite transporter (DMT)-like permease
MFKVSKSSRAFFLMSLSVGILACLDAIVKIVNAQGMHPFEIVFFRNVFGLVALLPFFIRVGFKELKTQRPMYHICRGSMHAAAMMTWFWVITVMPLADATALSFIMPIFASIGAIIFMNERSILMRWVSIGIGLLGMLLILRPGFKEIDFGTWVILCGAIFTAISKLMAKSLTRSERPSTIVAYMSLTLTFISFVPAVFVWTWPTLEIWLWLVAAGSIGSLAHIIQAQSFKEGDVTLVEPAGFLRLIWAAAVGYIIFGEVPQIWSWIGAIIIMIGVILLLRSEAKNEISAFKMPGVR